MRVRAALQAMVVAFVGGTAAANSTATPATKVVAAPSPDAQLVAASDRLKTAAVRLKTAARAAETQPGSAAAKNDLKAALGEAEASYEYLIGMFSKLNATDHQKQLELLRRQLEELKKQKQALLSKMAGGGASSAEWRRTMQSLAALSDRATNLTAAASQRPLAPTPSR